MFGKYLLTRRNLKSRRMLWLLNWRTFPRRLLTFNIISFFFKKKLFSFRQGILYPPYLCVRLNSFFASRHRFHKMSWFISFINVKKSAGERLSTYCQRKPTEVGRTCSINKSGSKRGHSTYYESWGFGTSKLWISYYWLWFALYFFTPRFLFNISAYRNHISIHDQYTQVKSQEDALKKRDSEIQDYILDLDDADEEIEYLKQLLDSQNHTAGGQVWILNGTLLANTQILRSWFCLNMNRKNVCLFFLCLVLELLRSLFIIFYEIICVRLTKGIRHKSTITLKHMRSTTKESAKLKKHMPAKSDNFMFCGSP